MKIMAQEEGKMRGISDNLRPEKCPVAIAAPHAHSQEDLFTGLSLIMLISLRLALD